MDTETAEVVERINARIGRRLRRDQHEARLAPAL